MKTWILAMTLLATLPGFLARAAAPSVPAATPAPPTATVTPTPTPAPSPAATPIPGSSAVVKPPAVIPGITDQSFLERYPHLKKNTFAEPSSNLYLGFSVGIVGIVHDRMFFSANFFQVHYIRPYLDYEVLSISYGTTTANPSYVQSNHFVFRTIPKLRVTEHISVGPLVGYEYVSFPKINAVLYDGTYQTKTEPFSSKGLIYGVGASQDFITEAGTKIKINEMAYNETYSTKDAGRGWSYLYDSSALRADATPIKAGAMFLIEIGMIF
jgi:hypothetical protein